ncbi:hypothetical protein CRG98_016049 [Punica granatum]|uniref:Uncharacterized protein n=1 Tax=Punica granatum TaxID=22663 RepID=A0A2I0K4T8_PUNGR|nr:hypothetical protein CRG98_016049 [Punica granatum]
MSSTTRNSNPAVLPKFLNFSISLSDPPPMIAPSMTRGLEKGLGLVPVDELELLQAFIEHPFGTYIRLFARHDAFSSNESRDFPECSDKLHLNQAVKPGIGPILRFRIRPRVGRRPGLIRALRPKPSPLLEADCFFPSFSLSSPALPLSPRHFCVLIHWTSDSPTCRGLLFGCFDSDELEALQIQLPQFRVPILRFMSLQPSTDSSPTPSKRRPEAGLEASCSRSKEAHELVVVGYG